MKLIKVKCRDSVPSAFVRSVLKSVNAELAKRGEKEKLTWNGQYKFTNTNDWKNHSDVGVDTNNYTIGDWMKLYKKMKG